MIELRLSDGRRARLPRGSTVRAALEQIAPELLSGAAVAEVDGRLVELDRPLQAGGALRIIPLDSDLGREVLRHSTAHVMAQALQRLHPGTKLAIGPPIEDGFYYDVDCPVTISAEDLPSIEAEMAKIIAEDLPIRREDVPKAEAVRLYQELGNPYKLELLEELPEDGISLYRQGEFVDLCRGPHVASTGRIKAFKLLSVAGAYWRGDSSRPMLQRIYGTAFPDEEGLAAFLRRREEAERRDHRKLGPRLGLFSFHDEAPGFVFWHPKGWQLYRQLEDFSRELQARHGYQEVSTPWVFRVDLWKRSGHWEHYRDNMFLIEREAELLSLKPMNCPGHCLLYRESPRSYRDLPLKFAEYGPLSRAEASGTLHGALRVRGLHQDDAHLFVREDQIEAQMLEVLQLVDEVYTTFGMPYHVELSTRPDDFLGTIETWDRAEAALALALERAGLSYRVNPKDGAFYGPKLDIYAKDAIGRTWQCATVQLDFQFPERFDLEYTDADGTRRRPVMIHRAILGSLERFIGVLTEHFAGAFPLWLAPEQVRVLPVSEKFSAFAQEVLDALRQAGIRAELDERNEKLGRKIRTAQLEQVPYMLIVGEREAASGTVAVRHRRRGDMGRMPLADLLRRLHSEIASRELDEGGGAGTP
ncbi:MAG TPA: threonine--tRNA ligase [Limnochordia bacterium]